MARLSARYRHFWRGRTYQHFWANGVSSVSGSANGATLTVTSSLIAANASSGANVAGQLLTINTLLPDARVQGATLSTTLSLIEGSAVAHYTNPPATFIEQVTLFDGAVNADANVDGVSLTITSSVSTGSTTQDGVAPLNTRLNARYRHFWGRKRSYRHFWAQYEGAGITGTLADGQLVVASLAVIEAGLASADANLEGQTLSIGITFDAGHDIVTEPGADLTVATSLVAGNVSAEANIAGQTLTVGAVLPDARAPFATMTISLSLIDGIVFVPPDALAIAQPLNAVAVTLFAGGPLSSANVVGSDQTVNVELIAGAATADMFNEGATLPVDVSLADGQSSIDAFADGATLEVGVTIEEGVADGEDSTVGPPMFARVAGPVSYRRRPEVVSLPAQAFGANFTVGIGIVSGKPKVDTIGEYPQPAPSTSPTHMMPVDVQALPESITKLLEVPEVHDAPAPSSAQLETFKTSETSVTTIDWIAYDNELLELI